MNYELRIMNWLYTIDQQPVLIEIQGIGSVIAYGFDRLVVPVCSQ